MASCKLSGSDCVSVMAPIPRAFVKLTISPRSGSCTVPLFGSTSPFLMASCREMSSSRPGIRSTVCEVSITPVLMASTRLSFSPLRGSVTEPCLGSRRPWCRACCRVSPAAGASSSELSTSTSWPRFTASCKLHVLPDLGSVRVPDCGSSRPRWIASSRGRMSSEPGSLTAVCAASTTPARSASSSVRLLPDAGSWIVPSSGLYRPCFSAMGRLSASLLTCGPTSTNIPLVIASARSMRFFVEGSVMVLLSGSTMPFAMASSRYNSSSLPGNFTSVNLGSMRPILMASIRVMFSLV